MVEIVILFTTFHGRINFGAIKCAIFSTTYTTATISYYRAKTFPKSFVIVLRKDLPAFVRSIWFPSTISQSDFRKGRKNFFLVRHKISLQDAASRYMAPFCSLLWVDARSSPALFRHSRCNLSSKGIIHFKDSSPYTIYLLPFYTVRQPRKLNE